MTSLTTLSFDYELDGLDCNAVMLSGDDAQAPTLLVFHGMEGRSDAQVEFCGRLAEIGYRAVAVDIFGREVSRHVARDGMDAGAEAMNAMLRDRDALRDRLFGVGTVGDGSADHGPASEHLLNEAHRRCCHGRPCAVTANLQ
jgi:dienelactone hydrolase